MPVPLTQVLGPMIRSWRTLKVVIALAALLALASCATRHGAVGAVSNIVVGGRGSDSADESCTFTLSASEVRAFFRRAVLITPRQEHDFYLRGPCYLRGTLSTRYETWHWEIRNLGTATITSASGDDTFFLADPGQESSLAED
jgi:hypothetical protein